MNKLKKWLPSLIMMAVIFSVSSISGEVINNAGLGKETYHINGHFILFTLLCVAFYSATKSKLNSFILTVVYAFSDEFHQIFVPGRSASMFDIFVDILGASLAVGLLWKSKYLLPKKLNNWLMK